MSINSKQQLHGSTIQAKQSMSAKTNVGNTIKGSDGKDGATFVPSLDTAGNLSWTNDQNLPNPEPINLKGPQGETGPRGEKGDPGETGQRGIQGIQGVPGKDGVSVKHSWNGTTLTITSASGTSSANLKGEQGQKGDKGDPGETGPRGEQGPAGNPGSPGEPGKDGKDGVSPTVIVEDISGGHRLTITDKNGPQTFNVMDGKDGEGGSGGGGVSVQSDWDINDENDPAYVKNRPFYSYTKTSVDNYLLADGTYTSFPFEELGGIFAAIVETDSSVSNVNEQTYTVIFDGIQYEGLKTYNTDIGQLLGNGAIISQLLEMMGLPTIEDTGEPFVFSGFGDEYISSLILATDIMQSTTHDVSITHVLKTTEDIVVKLPREYYDVVGQPSEKAVTGEIFNDYSNNTANAYSHAEGRDTHAEGINSHAEGRDTHAEGINSHAEGRDTHAEGEASHAEGTETVAQGHSSHAEGAHTIAENQSSHAEGWYSHAEGHYSHAEGNSSHAEGNCSHAEGSNTIAQGYASHAEGHYSHAKGDNSHAEGRYSHAEGNFSHAEGYYSHAEGFASHAEGNFSHAKGDSSHAEGLSSHAEGYYSHAEGDSSHAEGYASHAEGYHTHAVGCSQHVHGEYNIVDPEYDVNSPNRRAKYAHIVGNGTDENARSNAHTLDWNGLGWFAGGLKVGGTGQDDETAKEVALKDDIPDLAQIVAAVVAALPVYSGEVESL